MCDEEKDDLFNKRCGVHWIFLWKKSEFDPYTNANFRWIVDIKFQSKVITLLKRNIGEYLYDCGAGKYFLSKTRKALTREETAINWAPIKLSTSVQQKTPLRE